MKFIKIFAISVVIIFILQKPVFAVMDKIYEPHTHDTIMSEKLKTDKMKEKVSELRDLKDKKDKYEKIFKEDEQNNSYAYTKSTMTVNEYNEKMRDYEKYEIYKHTDLPKTLKHIER